MNIVAREIGYQFLRLAHKIINLIEVNVQPIKK